MEEIDRLNFVLERHYSEGLVREHLIDKINDLVGAINKLQEEVEDLKSKQEKMRKPIELKGNIWG
jgi:predicted transcriptional regulator